MDPSKIILTFRARLHRNHKVWDIPKRGSSQLRITRFGL